MIVNRVIIKNAKSIKFLDAKLRTRSGESIAVPYDVISAPNGQGKTTFLECLSLIGHIPCMTRAQASATGWNVSPSHLLEYMGRTETLDVKVSCPSDNKELYDWFDGEIFDGLTAVYVELYDGHYNAEIYKFVMLLEQGVGSGITSLLSQNFGDDDFSVYSGILYRKSDDTRIASLINRIGKGRCFTNKYNELIKDRVGGEDEVIVSFINTDMNDFGRGNDLRETPKLLNDNFEKEIIRRMGFPHPESNLFKSIKDKINNAVHGVMETKGWQFSNPNVVISHVSISRIEQTDAGLKIYLTKERHWSENTSHDEYHGESLSAGENEIFFILLILYIFEGKNAIILLDEPDLHVAGYMRNKLFDQILKIVNFSNQHLIVSSHSSAAMRSVRGRRLLPRSPALGGLVRKVMRWSDPMRTSGSQDHVRILLEVRDGPKAKSEFSIGYDSRYYWTVLSGSIDGFGQKIANIPIFGAVVWGFVADFTNQIREWYGQGAVLKFVEFVCKSATIIFILSVVAATALTITPPGNADLIHILNRDVAIKFGLVSGFVAAIPFIAALIAVPLKRFFRAYRKLR